MEREFPPKSLEKGKKMENKMDRYLTVTWSVYYEDGRYYGQLYDAYILDDADYNPIKSLKIRPCKMERTFVGGEMVNLIYNLESVVMGEFE